METHRAEYSLKVSGTSARFQKATLDLGLALRRTASYLTRL
jgi:hypothetical protein